VDQLPIERGAEHHQMLYVLEPRPDMRRRRDILDDVSGNIHLFLEGELAGFIVVRNSFDGVSINRAESSIEYTVVSGQINVT
jgi:hypothetical protein